MEDALHKVIDSRWINDGRSYRLLDNGTSTENIFSGIHEPPPLPPEQEYNLCLNIRLGESQNLLKRIVFLMGDRWKIVLGVELHYNDGSDQLVGRRKFSNWNESETPCAEVSFPIRAIHGEKIRSLAVLRTTTLHGLVHAIQVSTQSLILLITL